MQTGTRGTAPVSPANRTGKIYQQQLREKQAKADAANLDVEAIKRAEYQRGHEAGHAAGVESFTTALYKMYKDEGFEAVQQLLLELDDAGEDEAA